MIHVWYSNRLERLADLLVENLSRQRGPFPEGVFEKACLIVPNRNVATFVQFAIARTAGIAANLEFHFLEEFINELIFKTHPEFQVLTRGQLQTLMLSLFENVDALSEAALAPVRAYLDADGPGDARDLHAFQLAGRLARLFQDYSLSRPEMLAAWERGSPLLADTPLAATESWQRALWQRLFAAGGLLDRICRQQQRRYLLARDLFTILVREQWGIPAHLHFFGLSYVSRVHQGLLSALARHADLHLYTLSVVDEPAEEQKRATRKTRRKDAVLFPASFVDGPPDFDLDQPDIHLALRLWGRPGREYLRLLRDLPRTELHPGFVSLDEPPPTLLGRLQYDILTCARGGSPPPAAGQEVRAGAEQTAGVHGPGAVDDSIVILACPGTQREAEVIANEIWSLIRQDHDRGTDSPHKAAVPVGSPARPLAATGRERLRFNDIAVIIAGEQHREAYQTHLQSVFSELHGIPYNLMDSRLARVSRAAEAVEKLLDLPLDGFTRPELLGLLTHPAVRARFPDADADEWRNWCEETGVFHGADHKDHSELYIEKDLYNWDQGLRRLVLGAFLAGSRTGDDRVFAIGSDSYVPQEFAESRLANASRFVLLVRSLIADARFARDQRLPLSEWAVFLAQLVSTYVGAEDEDDERALGRCLKALYGLRDFDLDGRPVPYRIAREFARQQLSGLIGSRGQYLAEGVVISSFLPMRALPFRVVFICGLSAGQFPARDGTDPLDLVQAHRQAGDVSPRDRDKYLYLETLAVTGERLYLSYIARDSQTGEELEPSSVIRELQQVLRRGYLSEDHVRQLTRRHPLRRYDEKYFPSGGARPKSIYRNYSLAGLREAMACFLRRKQQKLGGRPVVATAEDLGRLGGDLSGWLGLCPLPDPAPSDSKRETRAISVRALRRFLECPLQGWGRLQLGLREEDHENSVTREDENFETSPPARAVLLRAIFFDALCAGRPKDGVPDFEAHYDRTASRLELQGVLPTGLFQGIQRSAHLEILKNWYLNLNTLKLEGGPFEVCRFGRAQEYAHVQTLWPPIILDNDLTAGKSLPRSVRVELYGTTEMLAADRTRSLRLSLGDRGTHKECLQGFLDYLCLLLADPADCQDYEVVVLPAEGEVSEKCCRSFAVTRKQAREYLQSLVADLLGGPHAYFLPCEAVFDFWPGEGRSLAEIADQWRENSRNPCSSFLGPIPHAERYPTPAEIEARQMIARRFGLFFQGRQPA
jgi:exodeoxyribonuclease V gamma subunit